MDLELFLQQIKVADDEDIGEEAIDKFDSQTYALLDYMVDYLVECSDLFLDLAGVEGELIEKLYE